MALTPFPAGRPVEALAAAAAGVAQILAARAGGGTGTGDCVTIHEDGHEDGSGISRFDRWIDALNRLPRPCLMIGTFAFFAFAMIDPGAFARRMEGLAAIPDPLWWLLGAVISFHFGAREAHYHRVRRHGGPEGRGTAPDPGVFGQNEGERAGAAVDTAVQGAAS